MFNFTATGHIIADAFKLSVLTGISWTRQLPSFRQLLAPPRLILHADLISFAEICAVYCATFPPLKGQFSFLSTGGINGFCGWKHCIIIGVFSIFRSDESTCLLTWGHYWAWVVFDYQAALNLLLSPSYWHWMWVFPRCETPECWHGLEKLHPWLGGAANSQRESFSIKCLPLFTSWHWIFVYAVKIKIVLC